ncbi:MAG TPA: hypothetical protein VIF14_18475 [Alphaproteobacteria bacterium]|jgi:hypothetical protein
MKRLFAILVLGLLVLGSAGLSAGGAAAGPAHCAPDTASLLDEVAALANPASYAERGSTTRRANLAEAQQYACNSACARACAARFGRCPTRECRQQFSACVRGCGC